MTSTSSTRRSALRRAALLLVLPVLALPFLAPTCGGGEPGLRTFARGSLVIPMDRCYQSQAGDTVTGSTPVAACPQTPDAGDVLKAYGLVYQLVRNGVAVYWIIDPAKAALDGVDFQVSYSNGFPAFLYDWATGGTGAAPTQHGTIAYRGGPFVVDGSDFAKASAILQQYRGTFGAVNVHVANVAFQGWVAKTMAGGWGAGGATPPKVALLDIGSTSDPRAGSSGYAKNSEPIIRGYLARAGLDFAGAGGTSAGPHGIIYDRLTIADFQPAPGSTDPRTAKLFTNGYQILWVPHWFAPGSCANATSQTNCLATLYSKTDPAITDRTLATIGRFVVDGKDLFAECAGLGSFEGVPGAAAAYQDGEASTHFHATAGVAINASLTAAAYDGRNFASPLLQLGDWPFVPRDGAIQNYRPATGSAYQQEVVRLVTSPADPSLAYFTLKPGVPGGRGTVVYLGGHVYSGYRDTLSSTGGLQTDSSSFQIGGTRLVLNTLFNLGAGCTESGVACATGQLGVCGEGVLSCDAQGQSVCAQVRTAGPEVCNGLDDDCDGLVDEDLQTTCYGGPAGTAGAGVCREGVSVCEKRGDGTWAMSACTGEVRPSDELCNGLDDDCDGAVDEALSQACYYGPTDTVDPVSGQPLGACRAGTQSCNAGSWTACVGQVLPSADACTPEGEVPADENCNGAVDEGCGCTPGAKRPCYDGPGATRGVGACAQGEQTCTGTAQDAAWGACVGQVLPALEVCNDADDDCDGVSDDGGVCGECRDGVDPPEPCYGGPDGTAGVGLCRAGTRACTNAAWGACAGAIGPSPELCDGEDNDCDGAVDDGAACGEGLACVNGACVPGTCHSEQPCPDGYACDAARGCVLASCGAGGPCAAGTVCFGGACVDPCEGVRCGAGSVCAGGLCTGGSCYATGCPAGERCAGGECRPDACAGVNCPAGTFCRDGDCVQACAFVSCREGERCDADGFCVADACTRVTCPTGDRCVDGTCEDDPCAGVACGQGQVCAEGACADDPCAGVDCPAGQCLRGQCFSTSNPNGIGADPEPPSRPGGGGGCASGGDASLPALALALLALAALRARRLAPVRAAAPSRRRGRPALLALALLSLAAAACSGDDEPARFDPAACTQVCGDGGCVPLTCGEERCVELASDAAHCGGCGNACGDGDVCVDGVCGPAGWVGPRLTSITPPGGARGALAPVVVELAGERFQEGAVVRVGSLAGTVTVAAERLDAGRLRAALDLSGAAAGELSLRVVNPDRVVSNSMRFDVTVQTAVLAGVTPAAIGAGQAATLALAGTGFVASSGCHLAGLTVPPQGVPTARDGDGLRCTVPATLPPGVYELWVVNEGVLASNRVQFTVTSETPAILAVSPSSAQAGRVVSIAVTGTGFDPTSEVFFAGAAAATAYVDATRLFVSQLDLGGVPQGTYPVVVKNGAKASNAFDFVVAAQPPLASSLSLDPPSPRVGDIVALTIAGENLPLATRMEVRPPGGAFAEIGAGASNAETSVRRTLSLAGRPEGTWEARLRFPDGAASDAFAFRVLSNVAVLRSATPSGGMQGATLALALKASNLQPGAKVHLRGPGLDRDLGATPSGADGLDVAALSLAGLDTGVLSLVAVNPGAQPSNALSFTVIPGPPTVTSVSPTSAQQRDTPVTVTIAGANFARPDASGNGGSTVMFRAPFMPADQWAPVPGAVTVVSSTELRVELDTRDAYAAPGGTVYTLTVWNPGGTAGTHRPAGTHTFTVLP